MKPVAIVQHEPFVPPGSVKEALEAGEVEHFVLEAWRHADWPSASELGALIVLGGTMSVDQSRSYPFLGPSAALMSDALERD